MRIVNIAGGLGNQMLQYAFAELLKKCFPDEDVFIDISHYNYVFIRNFKSRNSHNGFEITELFPEATIPIASAREIMKVSRYVPDYFLSRFIRRILPPRKTEYIQPHAFYYDAKILCERANRYYEGYWASIGYLRVIKSHIKRIYHHPVPNEYNAQMIRIIEEGHSVGLHIRRGDYLKTTGFIENCSIEYYRKAINSVLVDNPKSHFFVFSDDIDWCKDNITPLIKECETVFVTGNTGKNSYWDMFLMTYCKELIIANSTFSWWGAFLNKRNATVYAPKMWMGDYKTELLAETNWILI